MLISLVTATGSEGFWRSKGISISNCIEEFNGAVFTTPVTKNGSKFSSTSISMVLPTGFSLPKYFLEVASFITTEFLPFSMLAVLPCRTSIEKILKIDGSANNTCDVSPSFPFFVGMPQPLMRQKLSISGTSAANTGPCGKPVLPLLFSLPAVSVVVCTSR